MLNVDGNHKRIFECVSNDVLLDTLCRLRISRAKKNDVKLYGQRVSIRVLFTIAMFLFRISHIQEMRVQELTRSLKYKTNTLTIE